MPTPTGTPTLGSLPHNGGAQTSTTPAHTPLVTPVTEGSGPSYFSDSETDDRSNNATTPSASISAAKSPSDILSGVYRGIKKLAPSSSSSNRDESPGLRRQPSFLNRSAFSSGPFSSINSTTLPPATTNSPAPSVSSSFTSRPRFAQHGRSLSLQDSLAKPLPPEPPSDDSIDPNDGSLLTPVPPTAPIRTPLDAIIDIDPSDDEVDIVATAAAFPPRAASMDSRTSTMDSSTSASAAMYEAGGAGQDAYDMTSSQSSLASIGENSRQQGSAGGATDSKDNLTPRSNGPMSAGPSPSVNQQPRTPATGSLPPSSASSTHLSGLMCNVHRTTGREPHALVGATTTVLGDKLYVFGGRILSRSRPAPLTSDLYELDLIRRHWTKLETSGDVPPPRYFHSMCALGDTKLVCYGGMSPATNPASPSVNDQQPEMTVMSDIYIYDVPSRKWVSIDTPDAPEGRYAHCACILPSAAIFSSSKAPLSALHHNPSTGNPNEGRLGVSIDGTGGAEMIVVGGQDAANHYIEQISVFNLRSLKWTSTQSLGKSCGAYRSVVAPLPPSVTAKIGRAQSTGPQRPEGGISQEAREPGSSMLIYSNYNFLDVKLELQIRAPDGTLSEKAMASAYSPPGLRFPNGGVIDTHFVVSGTYLTSSKQEYALWALDLRTLTWSRIDAGGSVFSQGSWNRGVLWSRRNTFVILGNRKRSLVDDYNHRRINFSNVCMVELEAFGFYDNPRKTSPMSGFVSASSPYAGPGLSVARKAGSTAGGRSHSRASEELGEKALAMRELADMDILCITGERIPVNSRIVARRWGPYFVQLLREGTATQDGSDAVTLRSGMANPIRSSSITAGSSERNTVGSTLSMASTLVSATSSGKPPSTAATSLSGGVLSPGTVDPVTMATINTAPTPRTLPPNSRPRCLYLPHTYLTVQALLHFLYTSSLAPPSSPLCTPQILCSLLQIARPYRIDGLLEAVVERLHALLDSRNAAAVFNATAMAAGGGRGIDGSLNPNFFVPSSDTTLVSPTTTMSDMAQPGQNGGSISGASDATGQNLASRTSALGINTSVPSATGSQTSGRPASEDMSAATSVSGSEWSSEIGESERGAGGAAGAREIWSGELSSVIGLQKRGLRGLMEGRRMRERTGTNASVMSQGYGAQGQARVGLGIAGT
ncbi:hypothetical protein jhhlp_004736 [Lomentospora prolificans]|uniref:BTB domain-containing protein n=1 Tax=Lomentospora prolificans TaxID=41688 RepID=A0A2N3N8A5_9PEZI|nr:hypothetical protein jhhlp_004736 [Lomentospora prolificans]